MSMDDQKAQGGIPPAPPPPVQIYLMSQGAVISRALSLAAELGLADLLADGPRWFHTYAEALHSLRTGEPAFARSVGMEFFDYLATHPDEGEIFDAAMSDFGRGVAAAVVREYDFSGLATIVDVGGGHGSLVSAILQAHPRMTGILFDQPHVIEGARRSIGDAGLADRCDIVGGDFFRSVPGGGDVYVLRRIIHDWDDDSALKILRNCRTAMKDTARLLLVETVIPAGDEPHPGKLGDFVMLTALGGQERTAEEYTQLLDGAGFRLNRVVSTASPMSVVEGVPR